MSSKNRRRSSSATGISPDWNDPLFSGDADVCTGIERIERSSETESKSSVATKRQSQCEGIDLTIFSGEIR